MGEPGNRTSKSSAGASQLWMRRPTLQLSWAPTAVGSSSSSGGSKRASAISSVQRLKSSMLATSSYCSIPSSPSERARPKASRLGSIDFGDADRCSLRACKQRRLGKKLRALSARTLRACQRFRAYAL